MIRSDQPACFPNSLVVAVSSKSDGTMLDRGRSFHDKSAVVDRTKFCETVGLRYDQCVFQLIRYDGAQTYNRLVTVGGTDVTAICPEVAGDGLFTAERGVGLFLPVADCVATVIYDPVKQYLALLHLGRHSTYADLSTCAVKYFTERGSRPEDLFVWMSPSAGPESYHLTWFDRREDPTWNGFYAQRDDGFYLDLPGYNRQRCIDAGVKAENIDVSEVDTMKSDDYFSHSAGDLNGRIAVVAMMR